MGELYKLSENIREVALIEGAISLTVHITPSPHSKMDADFRLPLLD